MPSMKLTKSAVVSARPENTDYEFRDTTVLGFFCKISVKHLCPRHLVAVAKRPAIRTAGVEGDNGNRGHQSTVPFAPR